ncbi:uncharacterized protein VTP21DRAFT_7355 [Calcarisporiella thermophila]|uniref:uncharacterized protein n=1 Tax=Calcarisporiella thermophila TaxID=911321 RepID=UPI0037443F48
MSHTSSARPHIYGADKKPDDKISEGIYDFRSDTLTKPTDEMFEAMRNASRGDDVYGEDKTTNDFEQHIAKLCGHEAALLCLSCTLANQLALRAHLHQPPHSVLCDRRSHVFNYEAGGMSSHSQAIALPVQPSGNFLTAKEVEENLILGDDFHVAPTRVVCLENTLNGMVHPFEGLEEISKVVHKHGIRLHLDGARLWNASTATSIPLSQYCKLFDSVSLCFSKGLGAPFGAVLVGNQEFIKKARHLRKVFGGAWRQSGLVAGAAWYCLNNMLPKLERTHQLAAQLAHGLEKLGVQLTLPVDTNMVWIDVKDAAFSIEELQKALLENGIKIEGWGTAARLVVHYQISEDAVQQFLAVAEQLAQEKKKL